MAVRGGVESSLKLAHGPYWHDFECGMSKTRDDFRGARMRSRLFKSGVATPYKQFSRLPHPNPWICASCKFRAVRSRTYSTEQSTSEKPYYITTPIFYVNAGTIASYIYSKKPVELTKSSK